MRRDEFPIVDKITEEAYQKGRADALEQYTCHDDCVSENCEMCCRWDKLADCYEKEKNEQRN